MDARANHKPACISVPGAGHHSCAVPVPRPLLPQSPWAALAGVLCCLSLSLIIPLCLKLRVTGERAASTDPNRCCSSKVLPITCLLPGGHGSVSAWVSHFFLSSSITTGHCIFRERSLLLAIAFVTPMFLCQTRENKWKGVCFFHGLGHWRAEQAAS